MKKLINKIKFLFKRFSLVLIFINISILFIFVKLESNYRKLWKCLSQYQSKFIWEQNCMFLYDQSFGAEEECFVDLLSKLLLYSSNSIGISIFKNLWLRASLAEGLFRGSISNKNSINFRNSLCSGKIISLNCLNPLRSYFFSISLALRP